MRQNKRDELVRKALQVFYREGFHATGMDRLVAETGISKTSMYKHFRTKEDLILAVLRLRDEDFRNRIFRRMEELAPDARGRLLALFDVLGEWFAENEFRSCMFIKASSEYQDTDHAIHVQSTAHKHLFMAGLRELAEEAGAKDADELARQLMLLKEGAIVSAHLRIVPDPAGDAKRIAEGLIAAQIPA